MRFSKKERRFWDKQRVDADKYFKRNKMCEVYSDPGFKF